MNNREFIYFFVILVLCVMGILVGCTGNTIKKSDAKLEEVSLIKKELIQRPDKEIYEKLEQEDWVGLGRLFNNYGFDENNVRLCELDDVVRFLHGHVAMATGEYNEAVECFYCKQDKDGSGSISAWLEWAKNFLDQYPGNTVSHYLYGDALARSGDTKKAVDEFGRALEIDQKNVLALNSRGVGYWILSNSDKSGGTGEFIKYAAGDFLAILRISPEFSDAYVNLGVINLVDSSYLDRSIRYFEKAIEIDDRYWLAYNGQAVAYGASGKYWKYQRLKQHMQQELSDAQLEVKNNGGRGAAKLSQNMMSGRFGDFMNGAFSGLADMQPNMKIGTGGINFTFNFENALRGGVFLYVKEGDNLVVHKDDTPIQEGTWFALNYPKNIDDGK